MKKIKIVILSLTITFLLMSFYKGEEKHSLTVNVSNLRNSKGVVLVALYNKEGSIPDKHFNKYYKILTGIINENSATVTFEDLPEGKYAVSIVHDENKNMEIDKGFMLPKEGIGITNYEKISLRNRPNFSKASFNLKDDLSVSIKAIYM